MKLVPHFITGIHSTASCRGEKNPILKNPQQFIVLWIPPPQGTGSVWILSAPLPRVTLLYNARKASYERPKASSKAISLGSANFSYFFSSQYPLVFVGNPVAAYAFSLVLTSLIYFFYIWFIACPITVVILQALQTFWLIFTDIWQIKCRIIKYL